MTAGTGDQVTRAVVHVQHMFVPKVIQWAVVFSFSLNGEEASLK